MESTNAEMERVKKLHLACVWRSRQVQFGRVERAESSLWLTQDFYPPVETRRIEDGVFQRTSLPENLQWCSCECTNVYQRHNLSESKCLVGPECPREQRECLYCHPHDNRPSGESAATGQASRPSPVHTQWKKYMRIYSLYIYVCVICANFTFPTTLCRMFLESETWISAWPLLFPAMTTPFTVNVAISLSDTSHITEPLPPSTWQLRLYYIKRSLCFNIHR